jgi:hypothetical protein
MTPKLLKELQEMCSEAARSEMWGTIEIDFQRGVPVVIRQTRSKKLRGGEQLPCQSLPLNRNASY